MSVVFEIPGALNVTGDLRTPDFSGVLRKALPSLYESGCHVRMAVLGRPAEVAVTRKVSRGEIVFSHVLKTLDLPLPGVFSRDDISLSVSFASEPVRPLWRVLRDFYIFTMRSGGSMRVVEHGHTPSKEERLSFLIVDGSAFEEAFVNIRDVLLFKDEHDNELDFSEILAGPNSYVYDQGIRVFDLPKPSVNTYNFKNVLKLCDDGIAKYESQVGLQMMSSLMACSDEALVQRALASEDFYESGLPFSEMNAYTPVSEAFVAVGHKSCHKGVKEFLQRRYRLIADSISMYEEDQLLSFWQSNRGMSPESRMGQFDSIRGFRTA